MILRCFCSTGNASITPFGIYCSGWLDEGENPDRDETRDITLKEPLVYEYVSYIKMPDGSISQVPLFKGSTYIAISWELIRKHISYERIIMFTLFYIMR